MAHFAKINSDNVVENVLVVPDEQEHRGQEFLAVDLQQGGRWVQTSYNNRIRHRYAGIGMIYDEANDVFTYAQPFPSWTYNLETFGWDAPTPCPSFEPPGYSWDETAQQWIARTP
jgi:hypothetical protein